jgi:hypothetical protein
MTDLGNRINKGHDQIKLFSAGNTSLLFTNIQCRDLKRISNSCFDQYNGKLFFRRVRDGMHIQIVGRYWSGINRNYCYPKLFQIALIGQLTAAKNLNPTVSVFQY